CTSLLFFLYHRAIAVIYTLSLHDALPIFRSLLLGVIWREFSLANSSSPLSNHQRQFSRPDVTAARGSPTRTWVRAAATLQRYWIFYAKTISTRSTSWAT